MEERVNNLNQMTLVEVTKLKAFTDNKSNVAKITISPFDRVENIVGKGENAGHQHFLLFSYSVFQSFLLYVRFKSGFCGKELRYEIQSHSHPEKRVKLNR